MLERQCANLVVPTKSVPASLSCGSHSWTMFISLLQCIETAPYYQFWVQLPSRSTLSNTGQPHLWLFSSDPQMCSAGHTRSRNVLRSRLPLMYFCRQVAALLLKCRSLGDSTPGSSSRDRLRETVVCAANVQCGRGGARQHSAILLLKKKSNEKVGTDSGWYGAACLAS